MKTICLNTERIWICCLLGFQLASFAAGAGNVNLLERYPTALTAGDTRGDRARTWEFTAADVFKVERFAFEIGTDLRIAIGASDVGIGHCADGAVWAVLIPREVGTLARQTSEREIISHVWLRFHPKEIVRLFPPDAVSADGNAGLFAQMRLIAGSKITSSWQAGGKATIPEPKDMTVDVDAKEGPRRFFVVDTEARSARYVDAFENRAVKAPPAITPALAEAAFDQLWKAFDSDYAMFVLRPELDWAKLREQWRPKALAAASTAEFAEVCADMLKPLRDLHVWLTVSGANVPVFNRPRSANSNPSAHKAMLGELKKDGAVQWAVTQDKIGFIAIYAWNSPEVPAKCNEALEQMRDTRGLIVDVRMNGGGSEPLAGQFAGRFLEKEFVYSLSQVRNGSSHADLTEKRSRSVSPKGPWRYNRPVVVLIGQKCMSSNESFVGMMTGDPDVATLGDHTCGSSGNPKIIRLPLDMTVSVPQWIDYLPDGTPLDERGFQPQIRFDPKPGAFEGGRDDLLAAALERLRQAPLPEKPIEGPVFGREADAGPESLRRTSAALPDHSAAIREEAKDSTRPKVVAVSPEANAQGVAPVTELKVRFDRPMDPLSLKLDWESGGLLNCDFPHYDAGRFEFTVPVRLAPGVLHQIVLNKAMSEERLQESRRLFSRNGFKSPDQRLAGLFVWQFRTQGAATSSETNRAKATSVAPKPGSLVPVMTLVEVQFDRPMSPPDEARPYLVRKSGMKEPAMIASVQYDRASRTFRIPILLVPKEKSKFSLAGFRDARGILAEPVELEYQASEEKFSKEARDKFGSDAQNPQLLESLETMQKKRMEMTSLSERIQSVSLTLEEGLFVGMESKGSHFKWRQPGQFYGDVADNMMTTRAFEVGCDSQNWWWHYESDAKVKLITCPVKEMHRADVSICDPFGLTAKSPTKAAAELNLSFAGVENRAGGDRQVFESWSLDPHSNTTPYGSMTRWWIDPSTARPDELCRFSSVSALRMRFVYDPQATPPRAEAFARPAIDGLAPSPAQALDSDYTERLVIIRDGSDGEMSVRWGKQGPKGMASSGLN